MLEAAALSCGSVSYLSEYICPWICWIPLIMPACMPISPVAAPIVPMPLPERREPLAHRLAQRPHPGADLRERVAHDLVLVGVDGDLEVLDVVDAGDGAAHTDRLRGLAQVDCSHREREVGGLELLDDGVGGQALVLERLGVELDLDDRGRVGGELGLAHALDALQRGKYPFAHVGAQRLGGSRILRR